MRIPTPVITTPILKILLRITTLSHDINQHPSKDIILPGLDRASVLKTSLYSARIEGNPLDEHTLDSDDWIAKKEIYNLVDAVDYIRTLPARQPLTKDEILRLHSIVMRQLTAHAGKLRNEQNAIFDIAGMVRYMPPPPITMRRELEKLIIYTNTSSEFALITALTAHLMFEKIHPFIDGNGRVGRLLIPFIQKSHGEPFPLIVPFERYLERHRDQYYRHLELGMQHINEYILFMLYGIQEELELLESEMKRLSKNSFDANLLLLSPRQQEIYNLIREHTYLSTNMIHRRFLRIPLRTIRYDMTVLVRKKLITKVGETRAAIYKIV